MVAEPQAPQQNSCITMSEVEPKAPRLQLSLADFELLRRVGDGSYSHVVLARHRSTGREYALKVVDKQYILRHKVVDYIRRERIILDSLAGCEGIARLHFTFQDAFSLYLGLEYCPNGELYDQIRLRGHLDEPTARFYAAEVVIMLEELRRRGVVHRDLKPENMLLDEKGHLQLIDFGSAKQLEPGQRAAPSGAAAEGAAGIQGTSSNSSRSTADAEEEAAAAEEEEEEEEEEEAAVASAGAGGAGSSSDGDGKEEQQQQQQQQQQQSSAAAEHGLNGDAPGEVAASSGRGIDGGKGRAVSLVGTADYVSPEVLNNVPVTCAADLWALGCVLFQMLAGKAPFKSPSEYLTFERIVKAEYILPEGLSEAATDLIIRLLQLEPEKRIGAADLAELKAHAFFEEVDWAALRSQPAPEFVAPEPEPALSSASNSFDWELQSLASALPHTASDNSLGLE